MTVNKKPASGKTHTAPTGGVADFGEEASIAAIEKRIDELKESPKAKTKAVQGEIKRLKTLLNKVYIEYKRKVMNFEKENMSHIVFLRSTRGFYKLLGNSLLFYAFDIAPKFEIEARIYSDGDYEAKSDMGVVSLRGLDDITRAIVKLGAKEVQIEDKTGNIVVYKMPWEYSQKQIEDFRGQNTYSLKKFNQVIVTENLIPVLYLHLNDLMKAVYENVRRMEPVARETLGNTMVVVAAEMIRVYIEMANGRMSVRDGLKLITARINKIKSQLKIIVDLKIWNARVYTRIGDILVKTQEVLELEAKKEAGNGKKV